MPPLCAPKNNGYFNKNLIILVAYFSPNSYVTPLSIGTSFGESATRGNREQVGERKESRWDDGGWKDDERATRSTQIARTIVFFKHLVASTCQFFRCHVNPHRSAKLEFTSRYSDCINCIGHEAIVLRDTRATTVRRKCFDKIYFTSQKNITCEFIALGRQLLWCRWPGNV
ncbi:hypothetical protein ALC56_10290 [Trachymyrmex septentrionalis]|uniref:Uncharacterized protein n=1 Tax=Trachymyrmex septentrionalis TaxID=34720 RepID=A0A151JTU3_9HYME|nr:hypothetical protein ALC56_10290 [Trachymyrmex septentrionalis]